MNVQQSRFEAPAGFSASPPDLAHIPERTIGPISIVPPARLLRARDGRELVVEPLVMHVLLALAGADGATLSRDDLVAACWGRRIVGDDAINRAISHLRRDLVLISGDAVRVETIPKVGYRLAVEDPEIAKAEDGVAAAIGPAPRGRIDGRYAFGFVAVAALSVTAIVARPASPELALAIEPMTNGPLDRVTDTFAGDLSSEIARLSGPMTELTIVEPGTGSVDFKLKVSVAEPARERGQAALVRLIDQDSGAVVWSRSYSATSSGVLRDRAAYGISGILRCGLHRSSGDLGDPVTRRLYLAACDAVNAMDWPRAHSFALQIVERRPESAASWACLALATANRGQQDPAIYPSAAEEALAQSRKALALDPNSGLAYQAMAAARELRGENGFEDLAEGVRRDPEHAGLLRRYSSALAGMGYMTDAVEPGLRASALEPENYYAAQGALFALLGAGRLNEARRLSAHMQRIWGDTLNTGYTRHAVGLYDSNPARALAAFDRSPPRNPLVAERQRLELVSRVDPANVDTMAFDRAAERAFARNPQNAWFLAATAIRMGERERAFHWLAKGKADGSLYWLAPLFWPDTAALRRDPRFIAKMVEIGLAAKWHARGKLPDFCSETALGYDCRREIGRAAVKRAA